MEPDSISRLMKNKADSLFPSLLTQDEMEEIHRRRKKKAKKQGSKLSSKYFDVEPSEYVLKLDNVFDADGQEIPEDFDIGKYMDDMEDPEMGTLHDLKIDTRELRMADNFYDYSFNMVGPKVNPPWARQFWVGAMLFGEVCPCCSRKEFLDVHNIPKDMDPRELKGPLVFLKKGVCPKCKRTKHDLIQNFGLANYIQLCNVLGQRSGKSSSMAAQYSPYLLHRYLKFPNYASLSKATMQTSTQLTGTFVSLNFAKALGVMWTPFRKNIGEENEWFLEYFRLMDHYKRKYGKELYRMSTIYCEFYHKNIRMYPSGPRSSTLRGDTRIMAALDELGLFPLPSGNAEEDENSERANADEAHKSLLNSLGTVNLAYNELLAKGYYSAPPAILFNVSSPISQRDKVMRLLRESATPEGSQFILGVNLPTWEVNPKMEKSTPLIASAYASNKEKAERDWGANPPAVHSRFMDARKIVDKVFTGGPNGHEFVYQFDHGGELYGKIQRKAPKPKYPGIIAIDAGHTNNSFIIVGGHYDFETGKTKASTILECMPHDGLVINHNLLYQHVILPLAKELNCVGLAADQWQSLDLLYRIKEDMGLNPNGKPRTLGKQYSPRRKDFNFVLNMLQAGNMILPDLDEKEKHKILDHQFEDWRSEFMAKPVPHLFLQMNTVRDVGELRCPEKGDGYTDDIFRALVLFGTIVHQPKAMDRLSEARQWTYGDEGRQAMPRPASAGRSGRMARGYIGLR